MSRLSASKTQSLLAASSSLPTALSYAYKNKFEENGPYGEHCAFGVVLRSSYLRWAMVYFS